MNPITFTSQSPVWLSSYIWLESKFKKTAFPNVFFITLQSIGENEYGKTGHSIFFIF